MVRVQAQSSIRITFTCRGPGNDAAPNGHLLVKASNVSVSCLVTASL